MQKIKRYKIFFTLIMLALIAFAVDYFLGWSQVLSPWIHLKAHYLLLALLGMAVSYFCRALRCYDYFSHYCRGHLWLCLKITLMHNAFNHLMPMRSGETSFPILLKKYLKVPIATSLSGLIWFRIMDLHALLSMIIVSTAYHWLNSYLYVLLCVFWLLLPLLVFRLRPLQWLIPKILKRFPQAQTKIEEIISGLPVSQDIFWRSWFWTLINWFVKLLVLASLFYFFAEKVRWVHALMGVIGGDLTSILPIHSIAGIGTYEAGVTAALLPFGYTAKAMVAAAIDLHIFILGLALLTGLVAYFCPNKFLIKQE